MNRKQKQYANIAEHGQNLLAIYPQAKEKEPVKLCKKLHRLEREAHGIGLQLCNGPEMQEEEQDKRVDRVLEKVNALLGPGPDIFINLDPRGYALKIDYAEAKPLKIHKDWGGFGIICPEIEA